MHFIFFTLSFLLFLFAPTKYSLLFCNAATILFLIQVVPFLIKKSQGNYVNFYTIFYFSYFFVNFFYPTVLYPIDPEFFRFFTFFNAITSIKGQRLLLSAVLFLEFILLKYQKQLFTQIDSIRFI